MPTLSAIKENLLVFTDGTTQAIPHWGDSLYVIFFLVRHCERLFDGTKDPDLTVEGQARAERLGRLMEASAIDTVYSTPYKRTQQTAEPVQRRTKSPAVITYLPENQIDLLDNLVPSAGGKHLFIVGHQNTVPMALNYLKGDFTFKNIPDYAFDRFYVAVTNGIGETEVLELRY